MGRMRLIVTAQSSTFASQKTMKFEILFYLRAENAVLYIMIVAKRKKFNYTASII